MQLNFTTQHYLVQCNFVIRPKMCQNTFRNEVLCCDKDVLPWLSLNCFAPKILFGAKWKWLLNPKSCTTWIFVSFSLLHFQVDNLRMSSLGLFVQHLLKQNYSQQTLNSNKQLKLERDVNANMAWSLKLCLDHFREELRSRREKRCALSVFQWLYLLRVTSRAHNNPPQCYITPHLYHTIFMRFFKPQAEVTA